MAGTNEQYPGAVTNDYSGSISANSGDQPWLNHPVVPPEQYPGATPDYSGALPEAAYVQG